MIVWRNVLICRSTLTHNLCYGDRQHDHRRASVHLWNQPCDNQSKLRLYFPHPFGSIFLLLQIFFFKNGKLPLAAVSGTAKRVVIYSALHGIVSQSKRVGVNRERSCSLLHGSVWVACAVWLFVEDGIQLTINNTLYHVSTIHVYWDILYDFC